MSADSLLRGVSRLAGAWTYPLAPGRVADLMQPLRRGGPLRARVIERRAEAGGAVSFRLKPTRPVRYLPGQFVTLRVSVDGVLRSRNYSLTSEPGADGRTLAITVKPIDGGRVSRAIAERMAVGDVVGMGAPAGEFLLPGPGERLLFVTAGSGITPAVSMIGARLRDEPGADIVHLHFCPRAPDMIHGERMRALAGAHPGYQLDCLTTREGVTANSRLGVQLLDSRVPDWRERRALVCGPTAMADAAQALWVAAGLGERLTMERFVLAGPTGSGGQVTFAKAGKVAANDGQRSLLEEAEQAGLAPVHGCRMGVCHSCDCALLDGAVLNRRTGVVVDEPGARIQPCISVAAGDAVVDL